MNLMDGPAPRYIVFDDAPQIKGLGCTADELAAVLRAPLAVVGVRVVRQRGITSKALFSEFQARGMSRKTIRTIKKRPHQRCPAAKLLSKDEARRIAANITKLPELNQVFARGLRLVDEPAETGSPKGDKNATATRNIFGSYRPRSPGVGIGAAISPFYGRSWRS
jgi:hypothetical protein